MTNSTSTNRRACQHHNGWYITVRFWIFSKRIYVCTDCGHAREVKL